MSTNNPAHSPKNYRRFASFLLCSILLLATVVAAIPATPSSAAPAKVTDGLRLYVDPNNSALKQARAWQADRPADAAQMRRLGNQPQARWFGDWTQNVQGEINQYVTAARNMNRVPVIVLYNIPLRHCDSGGAPSHQVYMSWVQQVVAGIGGNRALVIIEPDSIALMDCLSPNSQKARYQSLSTTVKALRANSKTLTYLDAGHSNWVPSKHMADRLKNAGVADAHGFSLNVASFTSTISNVRYGDSLVNRVGGGKRFVVDTSRNGAGATQDAEWCNPLGRAAGQLPTISANLHRNVDAFLWVKPIGESDGNCNGGPSAGQWWPQYALDMMRRAKH